ncbi:MULTISPECIES: ABC transporter ATP-binding protein [unclassified Streptomyces]|uniref:ABC transporter ATP-binding protein n=1 Tax=unclassified Streptomyces TaxID=2593676 RepID=UPI002DD9CFB7|nr:MULTISPECIES: ABC transporter ATP-binding protein [unclassified Streptomyces]WSA93444.1 ABC transporter ATP-binding protein [Streptomyces sp. NBC_01795]WSB77813.1 ABC transporter ATP-binding protein [Streptomyces sp. NBC_01775]WSS13939.1 ABC transporter ATP-binding protein [Streptomyces sp. NBC_01186]WSS42752.1 ABC transporter ATP-binding protein [Streptomyces sp. NBC_01187]
MDAIEVEGLKRRYAAGKSGAFEAVRDISFSVREGEIFALLGTNGAGKTSTVEVLEGLARASEGSVRVLGLDPYTQRAYVRPRTGVMLQEGGFPSELTVAETARMWAGVTSEARPESEALALVGLSKRAGVRVKQLSGGERRRLDLALALIGRPEVLFLDEPTTGMDPEGRRDTADLVRELRAQGTTVLLTTHYLEEAEQLADRLAIMQAGRIVAAGTPEQVVAERPSRISFRLPAGVLPERLPLSVPAAVEGRTVSVKTDALQRSLTELLLWAREADVELEGLQARAASLEEAFLEIAQAGHRYEDEHGNGNGLGSASGGHGDSAGHQGPDRGEGTRTKAGMRV